MIRQLQPNESLEQTRRDLDYTRLRLARDTKAADLEPRLSALIAHLDQLERTALDPVATEQQILPFLEEANAERCRIYGELTARACTQQLKPNWPASFFRQPQGVQQEPLTAPARRGPNSAEAWVEVARERAADAKAMLAVRADSVGSVYMAGYAIECSLKALLRALNKPFPTSGSAGHDLRGLWEASGFRLSDLNDANGAKTFFIERWSTDLRYDTAMDTQMSTHDLLSGAGDLTGWIQTQVKRATGRR